MNSQTKLIEWKTFREIRTQYQISQLATQVFGIVLDRVRFKTTVFLCDFVSTCVCAFDNEVRL